jgi:hypothetical protein
MKTALFGLCLVQVLCACVAAQVSGASPAPSIGKTAAKVEHVSFGSEDGAVINADLYGEGDRGVVLAHGGQFTKESWQPQAKQLAREGYRVLAIQTWTLLLCSSMCWEPSTISDRMASKR